MDLSSSLLIDTVLQASGVMCCHVLKIHYDELCAPCFDCIFVYFFFFSLIKRILCEVVVQSKTCKSRKFVCICRFLPSVF